MWKVRPSTKVVDCENQNNILCKFIDGKEYENYDTNFVIKIVIIKRSGKTVWYMIKDAPFLTNSQMKITLQARIRCLYNREAFRFIGSDSMWIVAWE